MDKPIQETLCHAVVKGMLDNKVHVTTLRIKEKLRETFPQYRWYQEDVSDFMRKALDNALIPNLSFYDNGSYREYYTNTPTPVKKAVKAEKPVKVSGRGFVKNDSTTPKNAKKISRTKIVEMMQNTKGKFFTVCFIKKDGTKRVINGQVKKANFMDTLGFINFREANKQHRRVNPQTIVWATIEGAAYKV